MSTHTPRTAPTSDARKRLAEAREHGGQPAPDPWSVGGVPGRSELTDLLPTSVPDGDAIERAVLEAIEDDGNDPEHPTHPERIAGWRACAEAVRAALAGTTEAGDE